MSAFVKQLAVLSVLWALCELLLPDSRQQHMVRMAVSVLVMTALLSTVGELLQSTPPNMPVLARQITQTSEAHYRQTVLKAAANQTAAYCERFCERSGYTAQVSAFLRLDGRVERIEGWISPTAPLVQLDDVNRLIADQLGVDAECIQLSVIGAEEK